ncbi:MAG: inositol monophosphatase [Acidimicrobiales bacterium]|nr:inositol monophosphatase [Acidimicrobiales bacterium]
MTLARDLLALAEPIARDVGDHLRRSLAGAGPAITSKSTPTDLVTELDVWAEQHLVERLLAQRPDDGVLGEEGADRTGTSGVTWCIDPIDGTVNFVHRLPGFNVSVAALVDGRAVAGVVVSPLTGDTFTAVRDGGAHLDGTPIRCATPASLARAVVGTGFAYDPARRTAQAEVLARVIGRIADVRRLGAAATDLCLVAAGRLDAYWEVGLNPWDHAAGALIAEEAGARVGAISGGPPSERSVLAAPPAIWDALAALLVEAGAEAV